MKRTIFFWISFVVAIILAVYFSTRIIMTGLGHTRMSVVHNISITTDEHDKDLSAIATAAAVAPGTRTYSLNLDAMHARISAVPGVKAAAVRRMPNGNIKIMVKMHHAVALWTDGEAFYPLSADGTIVKKPSDTRDASAVVFRGDLPSDITIITNAAHNLTGMLDYLEWIENRRWNLITTGGITVMLPEDDPASAISSLVVLNNQHQILSKDIQLIDMRDSTRILVK